VCRYLAVSPFECWASANRLEAYLFTPKATRYVVFRQFAKPFDKPTKLSVYQEVNLNIRHTGAKSFAAGA
jgi:hypothetical protein